MLRITVTNGPAEQRWILQGRLIAPWIGELESSWKESLSRHHPQRCVVDLTEVTLIDERGEKLLEAMKRAGAEFIACGVYVKHVLEVIDSQCEHK
jgi:anti-anti-sigma regulatory factor